jgi:hypothetical protein
VNSVSARVVSLKGIGLQTVVASSPASPFPVIILPFFCSGELYVARHYGPFEKFFKVAIDW